VLAEQYDAPVMVDDSHAVGFVGPDGAGTPELFAGQDRLDIVTGTLGKARRRVQGVRQRPGRDRRATAATIAAIPVLQLCRAGGGGGGVPDGAG
jgi:hypothetical protein